MPEWERVRLGDLLIPVSSDRRENVQPDKEYRLLGVRLSNEGPFLRETKKGSDSSASSLFQVREGDFIYSRLFAWRGALGLIPLELDGCYVSNEFPLFTARGKRIDLEYLNYWFHLTDVIRSIEADCTGSTPLTRNRYKENFFLALEIPLPPLPEQQRIVARIKSILKKVEELDRLRNESIKQTQLAWAAYARKIFSEFNADTPLSDVVKVQGGGTPSKSNPDFWGGEVPWVTPKDMKVRRIISSRDKITHSALNQSAAKIIYSGALLIVTRGMILAHTVPIGLLEIPSAINQDMKALTPKEGLLPEFLLNWLWANNEILLSLVDKSTHDTRKLETSKLLSVLIPSPSVDQQQKAVDRLDKLLETLTSVSSNQSATDVEVRSLPASILARAFAGEL